jgi:hypothetical protein
MYKVTPETIYNEYHKQTFYYSKGMYPKTITNFTKIKSSDNWHYYERFAKMVNDNNGQIDYRMFIQSLAEFYGGRFNPKMLSHPKGIKIYRQSVKLKNMTIDKDDIYNSCLKSIKYIVAYCKEKKYTNLDQYLFEDQYLIPTIARHYLAGSICRYFVAMIPNITSIINGFPSDIRRDYFNDFIEGYNTTRAMVIENNKLRKISDNMDSVFKKLVNK